MVADLVGEVCSPTVVLPALMLVVSLRSAPVLAALGWFALAALFGVGIPRLVLVVLVRRGLAADRHLVQREQRTVPLLVAAGSLVVGLALLGWLGAPRPLLMCQLVGLAGLVTMTVISGWFKVSMHAASAMFVVGTLGVLFGPWALLALPMVGVVGWARLRAGRHSLAQVLAGLGVGAAMAGAFRLLT